MSNQIIAFNASANLTPNAFTLAGYTFVGWNAASDGSGSRYADSESYTMSIATDGTLYAQWVANSSFFITTWQTSSVNESITFQISAQSGTNMVLIGVMARFKQVWAITQVILMPQQEPTRYELPVCTIILISWVLLMLLIYIRQSNGALHNGVR